MRIRVAFVALLVASASAACSSNGPSAYCQRLTAANARLTSAQQDFYKSGTAGQTALAQIVRELRGVQNGAPTEIRGALTHLIAAFQQAERVLQHPTKQGERQLAQIASVLSADGKKVQNYAASKCK